MRKVIHSRKMRPMVDALVSFLNKNKKSIYVLVGIDEEIDAFIENYSDSFISFVNLTDVLSQSVPYDVLLEDAVFYMRVSKEHHPDGLIDEGKFIKRFTTITRRDAQLKYLTSDKQKYYPQDYALDNSECILFYNLNKTHDAIITKPPLVKNQTNSMKLSWDEYIRKVAL